VNERTLVLIKPDGVRRGLVGEVLRRIEAKGLVLVAAELRTLDRATAEAHYAEHAGKDFFPTLVEFITGGPLFAAVAQGPRAIDAWRALMGATDPVKAATGSIRGDLALQIGENIAHGSDSAPAAAREIALFFPRLS